VDVDFIQQQLRSTCYDFRDTSISMEDPREQCALVLEDIDQALLRLKKKDVESVKLLGSTHNKITSYRRELYVSSITTGEAVRKMVKGRYLF